MDDISHHSIIRPLGAGGMGEVFLAKDNKLDRLVAIKLLPPDLAEDTRRRQRFLTEAKAASSLNHPNVCIIHEVGETEDGKLFISMEHIDGKTLSAINSDDSLSIDRVLEIGIQVTDALEAAHSSGIIHRDIKLANIKINQRGQVKVLDFGLAKIMVDAEDCDLDTSTYYQTQTGQVLGTPNSMSPEQALGKKIDGRSDLFSLGVVLYELLTKRSPFATESMGQTLNRIVNSQPEPIERFNYEVPPEFVRIIRKCLEKEPLRRYQSANEVLVDLRNLSRDLEAESLATLSKGPLTPIPIARSPDQDTIPSPSNDELEGSDIFINFSAVDNQPLESNELGWVTQFQRHLELRLKQLSGEPLKVSQFPSPSDQETQSGLKLPSVDRLKAMVSIISPPFVKSEGCRSLLETFWQSAEKGDGLWIQQQPRIINVVKTPVEPLEIPPGLSALLTQLLGMEFFERNPDSGRLVEFDERFGPEARQRYFERIYDLAQQIWRLLSTLKTEQRQSSRTTANQLPQSGKTVCLAATSFDLNNETIQIRRELTARGHDVVPDRPLPLTASELEVAVRAHLEHCDLSVHLIGNSYGVIPDGAEHSLIEIQNNLAAQYSQSKGLDRVIWMPRGLTSSQARQSQFIKSLKEELDYYRGAEILQDNLETLRALLIENLTPKKEPLRSATKENNTNGPPRVYIICDKNDMEAIEPIEDAFYDNGLEVSLPDFDASEEEAVETHQQHLVDCDAVLIYYGAARQSWVDIKARNLVKATGYGRSQAIEAQAVYVAPPFDRRKEKFRSLTSQVIRQSDHFNADILRPFVEQIKEIRGGEA